jgi:hypothetical protein
MATRKKSTRSSKKVLKVDSPSKIAELEKILKKGKITIVLVYADWCGHCTHFKKDIWEPMCSKPAIHNRVSVRDDMIKKTSLANAKFDYLPSVLVVNEKGQAEPFQTPDGEITNAMPTPKTLNDMNRIVNVPVKSLNSMNSRNEMNSINEPSFTKEADEINASNEVGFTKNALNIPQTPENTVDETSKSKTYKPTPYPAPQYGGGTLYRALQQGFTNFINLQGGGSPAKAGEQQTSRRIVNTKRKTRKNKK